MDGTHCDYMFVVTLGVLSQQILHQDAQEPKQACPMTEIIAIAMKLTIYA